MTEARDHDKVKRVARNVTVTVTVTVKYDGHADGEQQPVAHPRQTELGGACACPLSLSLFPANRQMMNQSPICKS